MTVSPSPIVSQRFSLFAMRVSADIGSPWLPVEITQTSPSGRSPMSSMSMSDDSGMCSRPISRASAHVLLHRQAERGDLAAEGDGGVGDLLHPVHVAGEAGDDDAPALVLVEQVVEHGADALLGAGVPVRRRRWWSRPSAGGRPARTAMEPMRARSVSRPSTGVRSSFQSPVCMITPCGRVEGGGEAVRHRVRDGDELDVERTDLAALAVGDRDQLGVAEQPRLLDAVAGQAEGERRAVDREGQLAEQVRQAARRGPRGRGWRCSR